MTSETYKNKFSYTGLRALYDYLDELGGWDGGEFEFDLISICCEYEEYDSFDEIKSYYHDIKTMDDLENRTTVIKIKDSDHIIIANF